jgi:hypothetical protein
MINSVKISPIDVGNHSTMIDGKYFDKKSGQNITLLTHWGIAIDRPLAQNEQKWIEWFKPNKQSVDFTWDDKTEVGKKIEKWISYLQRHSLIKVDGNDNAVNNPQFKLVDSREVHIESSQDIRKKLTVGNLVMEMLTSEMMQAAFLMGANPVGKTTEQIFSELCEFNIGKCMERADKFLSDWNAPDRKFVVYAQKAIDFKIISLENGIYKLNNTTIGAGIDDIVLYLKNNPDTYNNYVKKQVDEKDVLPVSVSEDVKVSFIIDKTKLPEPSMPNNRKNVTEKLNDKAQRETLSKEQEDKRQQLIGELKRLKVPGCQLADKGGWSIEKIEAKLKEATTQLQPA